MNITDKKIESVCIGCGACSLVCPKKIIEIGTDRFGFYKSQITDAASCIDCGKCVSVCPAREKSECPAKQKFYWGYGKNTVIRKNATSGGIFTAIAEEYIKNNGIVYAAVLDENSNTVLHKSSKYTSLSAMSKSKYVQSFTGGIFADIKADLDDGKKVLFCGTPCQVAGLKNYLGKEYENLLCIDFICHGVPSAKLFSDYTDALTEKYSDGIENYDFRSKADGWGKIRVSFRLKKKNKEKTLGADPFNYMFEKNLSVNPACAVCGYVTAHRCDIILGDFWRYKAVGIDENTAKDGISLCIGNTEKGLKYLSETDSLYLAEIEYGDCKYAFRERKRDIKPTTEFYGYYVKNGYKAAEKKYASHLFARRIKAKLKILTGRK